MKFITAILSIIGIVFTISATDGWSQIALKKDVLKAAMEVKMQAAENYLNVETKKLGIKYKNKKVVALTPKNLQRTISSEAQDTPVELEYIEEHERFFGLAPKSHMTHMTISNLKTIVNPRSDNLRVLDYYDKWDGKCSYECYVKDFEECGYMQMHCSGSALKGKTDKRFHGSHCLTAYTYLQDWSSNKNVIYDVEKYDACLATDEKDSSISDNDRNYYSVENTEPSDEESQETPPSNNGESK